MDDGVGAIQGRVERARVCQVGAEQLQALAGVRHAPQERGFGLVGRVAHCGAYLVAVLQH